jgi:purine nucleoside phosphorylase
MTHDDIIRLAREAGFVRVVATHADGSLTTTVAPIEELERFAALVAAAERERMDLNSIHSCHAECDNPFCVRVREAVAHEREQCAKLCEEMARRHDDIRRAALEVAAEWIRARGNE